MSDEESFVILGTSPMPSLAAQEELDSPSSNLNSFCSLDQSAAELINQELENGIKKSVVVSIEQQNKPLFNAVERNGDAQAEREESSTVTQAKSVALCANNSMTNSNRKNSSAHNSNTNQSSLGAVNNESMAASFILGEINADVLKTSVYSQFPSLCSMEACAEDVIKLQNFMSEYVELKNTLAKVNSTMKQFYHKTQQWKDDMQCMELNYQQQLQECQQQIAELRNENLELKRDINSKIEHVSISDTLRQKEHDELVQCVSEKAAIIENMRAQINKLEQQQLASFEYIPKNVDDSKEKPDYVDRLEHQRVVKGFERQLSELLAKNLDLTDVQKQYVDEITCLKVNMVAAEELIRNHQAEINLLKADNMEKSDTFTTFTNEREEIKEELTLLRQQVDVYSRDFEMERVARQNLAGEKDQLLQDLRLLQRKNQELIEDAQRQYEAMEKQRAQASSSSSAGKKTSLASTAAGFENNIHQRPIRVLPQASEGAQQTNMYSCPICSKSFKNISILDSHVNDCLDKQN